MVITIKEAEKKYGFPKRTLYYLIDIGALPRVRVSAERVFLKVKDIEKLIDENYGIEKKVEDILIRKKFIIIFDDH